jgi:hypothetical protein
MANSIALRAIASASSSNNSCINAAIRLRDPRGRPVRFPLWPFSNCISFSSWCGVECNSAAAPVGASAQQKARRGVPAGLQA